MNYDDDDDDEEKNAQAEAPNLKSASAPASVHPAAVQDLIKLIFDLEMMNTEMKELGYDAKKMPLGKISKSTITKGYKVLQQIAQCFEEGGNRPPLGVLEQLSSEFYTVIPHDFGFQKMANFIIQSKQMLKEKLQMVESLADIALATKLLSETIDVSRNPIDVNYDKLHCEIVPVERSSSEFKAVEKFVKNTHAKTHNQYSLRVVDLFKIDRAGEQQRFAPWEQDPNRKLLWHGSRLTNWTGILSTGLRIAPPEAPVTGYMFDKGVYFADMVSKSANYCFTNRRQPTGLMLLCEVALGDSLELLQSDYHAANKCRKANKQSCKGLGKTEPDPRGDVQLENGCVMPTGKPHQSEHDGALLYNEFIVYDTSQIKMKYLLRLDFQYNINDYF